MAHTLLLHIDKTIKSLIQCELQSVKEKLKENEHDDGTNFGIDIFRKVFRRDKLEMNQYRRNSFGPYTVPIDALLKLSICIVFLSQSNQIKLV